MKNQFYVYVYLNPIKSGNFNYGKYHFDYEPFYVGKGHNNRMYNHLNLIGNNQLKNNKLKKILKSINKKDFKSEYIILQRFNLLESNAFKLEINMIKTIGRRDLGTGPLTNLTDGGEGFSNYIFTEEHRQNNIKAKLKYYKNNIIWNKNIKMSKNAILKCKNTWINKQINGWTSPLKNKKQTEIHKKRNSEGVKKYYQNGGKHGLSKEIIINGISYPSKTNARNKLKISKYKLNKLIKSGDCILK